MSNHPSFDPIPARSPAAGGFTLIELLVAISIITLLVGLLMPHLSKGYGAAQRSTCLSNLRQIGIGLLDYRYHNQGRIPNVQTLPVDPAAPTLMAALSPYIVTEGEIYRCPSDKELYPDVGCSYEYFVGFYLISIQINQANAAQKQNELMKLFDRIPSLAFIMTDAEAWHSGGPGGVGRNALYLDGHADWFALPQSDATATPPPTP